MIVGFHGKRPRGRLRSTIKLRGYGVLSASACAASQRQILRRRGVGAASLSFCNEWSVCTLDGDSDSISVSIEPASAPPPPGATVPRIGSVGHIVIARAL